MQARRSGVRHERTHQAAAARAGRSSSHEEAAKRIMSASIPSSIPSQGRASPSRAARAGRAGCCAASSAWSPRARHRRTPHRGNPPRAHRRNAPRHRAAPVPACVTLKNPGAEGARYAGSVVPAITGGGRRGSEGTAIASLVSKLRDSSPVFAARICSANRCSSRTNAGSSGAFEARMSKLTTSSGEPAPWRKK